MPRLKIRPSVVEISRILVIGIHVQHVTQQNFMDIALVGRGDVDEIAV